MASPSFFPARKLVALILWIARTAFLTSLVLLPCRATSAQGLPYSQFYSFDEIGDVSGGADLSFDDTGRLAVTKDGVCLVLNDSTWLNQLETDSPDISVQHVIFDEEDSPYFGAVGSWGRLRRTVNGLLQAEPLMPASSPMWTLKTDFNAALETKVGVCFSGFNGLVYWLRGDNRTVFHQISGLAHVFSLSGKVFVSSYEKGTLLLDQTTGELSPAPDPLSRLIVQKIANLPGDRAIIASSNHELIVYHAGQITTVPGPWSGGTISSLQALPEGNVALAVLGRGLYIVDAEANIISAVVDTEYKRISALASRERGVLWAETESGILKILYNAPVTVFGQALGLTVTWPQMFAWQNRSYIASGGRLYESDLIEAGEPRHFRSISESLLGGIWALGTWRDWLIVGGSRGIFGKKAGEEFHLIAKNLDVGKLFILESGLCFVVGTDQIALFRCDGDQWREIAPRVPGIGFPAAGLTVKNAAWVEIGANLAGRISFDGNKISARLIDSFPWRNPRWIHISAIGETVVLAGPESGRMFFDETTGELAEHSPLEGRLNAGPYWAARIKVDDNGTWWISHQRGIYLNKLNNNQPEIDNITYRMVSEHISTVHILEGNQVWLSTGSSLYRVDAREETAPLPVLKPKLLSVRDSRTGDELMLTGFQDGSALPFSKNTLALRFFSGSYAIRQGLHYEVRLNQSDWWRLDGSMLTLSNLHEGNYIVAVRIWDVQGPIGQSEEFRFTILPPLSRSWFAFLIYIVALCAGVFGLSHFLSGRARQRSAALEQTVAERTKQLKQAMEELEHEARAAATLAERNRLAGEIHDSLEQSFSALSLQLETTANFPHCPPEIGRGLSLARNMVTFSRDEIRHAIWDLHSPLLEKNGLEGALRQLMTQFTPDSIQSALAREGQERPLSSSIEHHLLRIAQEAIANAVKHANANNISVGLVYGVREVVLSVTDDGCGFDPRAILEGGNNHFGLRSLRGRAAKIDGTLMIESSPQAGTSIIARVPLPNI